MSRYEWGTTSPAVERLKVAVEPARQRVVSHPLYHALGDLPAVVTFMEHHAFAVWDFMSLLKTLQRQLTCVRVPWVPEGPAASRRLINEIVLVEESDELGSGFISHFELYIGGMTQAGADTTAITSFLTLLRGGEAVPLALKGSRAPEPAAEFVTTTWEFIDQSPVHCQAAAFAFGREDLIPDMFDQVAVLNQQLGDRLSTFVDYLRRHIQVDSEEHTPMAMQMLADLCGDDEAKWAESRETIETAFAARVRLWDGIMAAIRLVPHHPRSEGTRCHIGHLLWRWTSHRLRSEGCRCHLGYVPARCPGFSPCSGTVLARDWAPCAVRCRDRRAVRRRDRPPTPYTRMKMSRISRMTTTTNTQAPVKL